MKLKIDQEKCVGCRTCEIACSFHHKKVCNPEYSSIRIVFLKNDQLDIRLLSNCDCNSSQIPLCIEFCPKKAINIF